MNQLSFNNECAKSELDLFMIPPTDLMNKSGIYVNYPASGVFSDNQSEFIISIPKNQDSFIDLSECRLYVKCRIAEITKKNDPLTDTCEVSPVNNFGSSLWKQVECQIASDTVGNSNSMYAYGAYFETLLSNTAEAKKTICSQGLFYKDTAKEMENLCLTRSKEGTPVILSLQGSSPNQTISVPTTELTANNDGLLKRRKIMIDGKGWLELVTPVHSDLFKSDRYLINNTELKLIFTKNNDEFLLKGKGGSYTVIIDTMRLKVRHQKISENVSFAIEKTLLNSNVYYPMKKNTTKKFYIKPGSLWNEIELSSGLLPTRIVLGLVETESVLGKREKNPFAFGHFGLREISLKVSGEYTPYNGPIKCDFANNFYMSAYETLQEGLKSPFLGCDISREEYPQGYTIFVFNLEPTTCEGHFSSIQKTGSLVLSLDFTDSWVKEHINTSLDLIAYFEFEGSIELNHERKVVSGAFIKK